MVGTTFTRKPPVRTGETPLGAVHTADIVVFKNTLDTVDRPWTPQDRKLADLMSSYPINFATAGDPNGPGLPQWPAYTTGQVMELGDHVGPIPALDARELDWLDEYVAGKKSAAVAVRSGVSQALCIVSFGRQAAGEGPPRTSASGIT